MRPLSSPLSHTLFFCVCVYLSLSFSLSSYLSHTHTLFRCVCISLSLSFSVSFPFPASTFLSFQNCVGVVRVWMPSSVICLFLCAITCLTCQSISIILLDNKLLNSFFPHPPFPSYTLVGIFSFPTHPDLFGTVWQASRTLFAVLNGDSILLVYQTL